MEFFVLFLLASLASYRLALMFSKELGPCRIFERIRALPKSGGCWSKGISCFMCESVWWSATITFWLWVIGVVPFSITIMYWMSVSGMAVLINEKGPKLD